MKFILNVDNDLPADYPCNASRGNTCFHRSNGLLCSETTKTEVKVISEEMPP